MGDIGYPKPSTPSMGLGPVAEVRGGLRETKGGKKRALRALEEWPPDPEVTGKGSSKRKTMKRLQGNNLRKGIKDAGSGGRGQVALMRQWLETGKGGLGPRKEQEEEI